MSGIVNEIQSTLKDIRDKEIWTLEKTEEQKEIEKELYAIDEYSSIRTNLKELNELKERLAVIKAQVKTSPHIGTPQVALSRLGVEFDKALGKCTYRCDGFTNEILYKITTQKGGVDKLRLIKIISQESSKVVNDMAERQGLADFARRLDEYMGPCTSEDGFISKILPKTRAIRTEGLLSFAEGNLLEEEILQIEKLSTEIGSCYHFPEVFKMVSTKLDLIGEQLRHTFKGTPTETALMNVGVSIDINDPIGGSTYNGNFVSEQYITEVIYYIDSAQIDAFEKLPRAIEVIARYANYEPLKRVL